jgi:glycine hydroxymethyltransferase
MPAALESVDPTIAYQLWLAHAQQDRHVDLSASRNYVSETAWQAAALVRFDGERAPKGSQGPRGPGLDHVTETIERVASARARSLFGGQYASLRVGALGRTHHLIVLATMKPGEVVIDLVRDGIQFVAEAQRMNRLGQLEPCAKYPLALHEGHPDYEGCKAIFAEIRPALVRVIPSLTSTCIDFFRLSRITGGCNAILAADLSHLCAPIAARHVASPLGLADIVTVPTHGPLRGPRGAVLLSTERCRRALEQAVRTYCVAPPELRALATQAVALKEALHEGYGTYYTDMLATANGMRAVLHRRGVPLAPHEAPSHLVQLDCTRMPKAADEVVDLLARAHIHVERYRARVFSSANATTQTIGLSTAAITARGLTQHGAEEVADMIADVLLSGRAVDVVENTARRATALCARYPAVSWLSA